MSWRTRLAAAVIAAILSISIAHSALAQTRDAPEVDLRDGRIGKFAFYSATPTGPTQLMASTGQPTIIHGDLRFPPVGTNVVPPLPAMIISHGSGGVRPDREIAWADRLTAQGVAVLVLDSFGPRGITTTAEDQTQLPLAASIADALFALKLLASHPAIDPERIGIMGFSKGGQVALYTALEAFRRSQVEGGLRFALHIALYASCSIPYVGKAVQDASVVMLLGGADDYTPATHCLRYTETFKRNGARVRTIVYPDAPHGFDVLDPPRVLSRVTSARDCGLDIQIEPLLGQRWDSGEIVQPSEIDAYVRNCLTRGATFGGNAAALAAAEAEVRAAVASHLRPGR